MIVKTHLSSFTILFQIVLHIFSLYKDARGGWNVRAGSESQNSSKSIKFIKFNLRFTSDSLPAATKHPPARVFIYKEGGE